MPVTATGGMKGDHIVFRFGSSGYLDPLSTYISFTINNMFGTGSFPTPASYADDLWAWLKIDGSGSSAIKTLRVSAGGVELQRIENYNRLVCMLTDATLGADQRRALSHQGFSLNDDDCAYIGTIWTSNPNAVPTMLNTGRPANTQWNYPRGVSKAGGVTATLNGSVISEVLGGRMYDTWNGIDSAGMITATDTSTATMGKFGGRLHSTALAFTSLYW